MLGVFGARIPDDSSMPPLEEIEVLLDDMSSVSKDLSLAVRVGLF